jgi:putative acetyltransferase
MMLFLVSIDEGTSALLRGCRKILHNRAMNISIRFERLSDHAAIRDVTQRAFAPMPFADGDEHELIGKLRDDGVLALSLVADQGGIIIGQVTFTPAFAADGSEGWYTLGPVAVEPNLQHKGVGCQLIEAGLQLLRERNAAGCILVGNPLYYRRFGFKLAPHLAPEGGHAEYFQILPLGIAEPKAVIDFHPMFNG